MNDSFNTLSGLGLIGDGYDGAQLQGIFSSIVGGLFGGGGSSKTKETVVKPAKPAAGKISPLTVGLIAGGALVAGVILVGVLKRR
jgi:hypothetical protein